MKQTTKFRLFTNLTPMIKTGFLGGIYCLATPTDAKLSTALAITLLTGYAARWGMTAGHYIGLPFGSRTSGLTTKELKEMYNNPAQVRQIMRDLYSDLDQLKINLRNGAGPIDRSNRSPRLRAHARISFISAGTSFALAALTCCGMKPPVSHFMLSTFNTNQATNVAPPPLRPLSVDGITFRSTPEVK